MSAVRPGSEPANTDAASPELVPGKSARYWSRWLAVYRVVGISLLTVLFLLGLQTPVGTEASGSAMGRMYLFGILFLAVNYLIRMRWSRARRREQQAGYFTSFTGQGRLTSWFRKRERNGTPNKVFRTDALWHLDPNTGTVIRPPHTEA